MKLYKNISVKNNRISVLWKHQKSAKTAVYNWQQNELRHFAQK